MSTLSQFVSSWEESYTFTDLWYDWIEDWDIDDDAYHPSIMHQINSSWLKKRMVRDDYAIDDVPGDDTAFTPHILIGEKKYTYLFWVRRFDRFIEEYRVQSGKLPSNTCSNEEVTVAFNWFIYN